LNKEETSKLFSIISAAFPKDTAFAVPKSEKEEDQRKETIRIWQIVLADVPFDLAQAAVLSHSTTCVFPPSIAEIKGWVLKIQTPQIGADEAWEMTRKAVRKFGRMCKFEAMASLPPAVKTMVERFGWHDLCMSENIDYLRGQFYKMWDVVSKREQEKAALPPAVRKLIGQIEVKRLDA
jgi:hypothetical protein